MFLLQRGSKKGQKGLKLAAIKQKNINAQNLLTFQTPQTHSAEPQGVWGPPVDKLCIAACKPTILSFSLEM